jgi:hypothetical protein
MPRRARRAPVLRLKPDPLSIPILLRDGDGGARDGHLVARPGLLVGWNRISRAGRDVGPLPPLPSLRPAGIATPMHRPKPLSKALPLPSAASEQDRKSGRDPLLPLSPLLSSSCPGLRDMVFLRQRDGVCPAGNGGGQPGDGDGGPPVRLHPHPPFLSSVCELLMSPQQSARGDGQEVPGKESGHVGRLGEEQTLARTARALTRSGSGSRQKGIFRFGRAGQGFSPYQPLSAFQEASLNTVPGYLTSEVNSSVTRRYCLWFLLPRRSRTPS